METKTIINDAYNAAVITGFAMGYSYVLRKIFKDDTSISSKIRC